MKALAVALLLLLAGCHSARVTTSGPATSASLPRPDRIAVTDFIINGANVHLDSSPGARVQRTADGTPVPEAQAKEVLAVREALMQALVRKLDSYGLPAMRVPDGAALSPGTLLVRGDIGTVDEGNRLRRMVVGFGAGQSKVTADVQMFSIGAGGSRHFIENMTGSADSGHMPGGAMTMGAGTAVQAASGASHIAGEARQGPEAEAAQIGQAIAKKIGGFAVSEGWIPASAVQ